MYDKYLADIFNYIDSFISIFILFQIMFIYLFFKEELTGDCILSHIILFQFLKRRMFFSEWVSGAYHMLIVPLWRAADQNAQAGFSGILPLPPAAGCHRNSNARGLKYLVLCNEWCPVPMLDNVIGHRVLSCLHHHTLSELSSASTHSKQTPTAY